MSDDEYYGNSPLDEYDEYWDEGAVDVAGDLAEHTIYSPVWQDDPDYGLNYTYSDWEYYSDDYYDEDPVLLIQNPQDGSPPRPIPIQKNKAGPKGRKRKLDDIEDIPAIDLGERRSLEKCVLGTVWKTSTVEPKKIYQEGEGEKVALLKNWKTVFKEFQRDGKHIRRTFGNGQLRRDESWANNMSLEDMGLRSAKRRELTDVAEEADQEADTGENMSDSTHEETELLDQQLGLESDIEDHEQFEDTSPRKRFRRMVSPSPPPFKESSTANVRTTVTNDYDKVEEQEEDSAVSKNPRTRRTGEDEARSDLAGETKFQSKRSRKRRASSADDEAPIRPENNLRERPSKRLASSRVGVKTEEKAPSSRPASRVTRSQKK